ncbi:MAG: hypothetical protein L0Y72_16795 [Gemmataceae bacterium]|nr:hypothetical protein [Gemmataceae bacterium]MCI0740709.1 hypothetical protein [Gemmataceae bacterium]
MNSSDPFPEIAQGLLKKTKAGQAKWTQGPNENEFELKLPQSKIRIAYESPTAELDYVSFSFFAQDGNRAGVWEVHEGDDHWPVGQELYYLVSRDVTGLGKVLADVENFIK